MLSDELSWSPEQIREFSTTIDTETDRLTALIDNLLDMSRLQTGALPISLRATAVNVGYRFTHPEHAGPSSSRAAIATP
jgi:two-component system sensor histidine kinase KdpD